MDLLLKTAENFKKLFDIKYNILLGKKGKEVNVVLIFRDIDFHHLAGLQYIEDMPELKRPRDKVFVDICNDSFLRKKIYRSDFYSKIEDRVKALNHLENLLDNEKLVFSYDHRINKISKIKADFLFQSQDSEQIITYIFNEKIEKEYKDDVTKEIYCKSIFPKDNIDYTQRQSKYTILKINKMCISTNTIIKSFVNPNYREK